MKVMTKPKPKPARLTEADVAIVAAVLRKQYPGIKAEQIKSNTGHGLKVESGAVEDKNWIGSEHIFLEQWDAAEAVMKILREGRRVPIVIAQFQSGKTAAIIAIAKTFIDDCMDKGRTFQIFLTCGLSDLDLLDQTNRRFTYGTKEDGSPMGAGLDFYARKTTLTRNPREFDSKGVIVINRTKLNRYAYPDVAERLILIDEAHIALTKGGTIDRFLRAFGVKIWNHPRSWDNSKTNTFVVPVSATPFSHTVLASTFAGTLSGAALFESVYMHPGEGYVSVKMMHAKGRFEEVRPLFHKDEAPTEFFEAVLEAFAESCRLKGPGYLVMRATGTRHSDLVKFFSTRNDMDVVTFDASSKKNENSRAIKQMNEHLSKVPPRPEIILIRGAMRAGITLMENHIRGWVETRSKQCDTQTQAGIGRACGYNRKECYPIYCNLKAVEDIITYFEEAERGLFTQVPAGGHCYKAPGKGNRDALKESTPFWTDEDVELLTLAEAVTLRDKLNAGGGKKFQKKTGDGWQISTISGNVELNFAKQILEGVTSNPRKDGRATCVGIHIDAASPSYPEHFRKLIAMYPKWEGFVARLKPKHRPHDGFSYQKAGSGLLPDPVDPS